MAVAIGVTLPVGDAYMSGKENDGNNSEILMQNLDRLHTTALGVERIRKNLDLEVEDVVAWCREKIQSPDSIITRRGKNWYILTSCGEITVNAYSYTIITAHKKKK